MADIPVQVIVAAFNDLNGASQALKSLKEAKKERLIEIEDAAVLTKDADGKVKIKETADMRAGKGATIGAIAGRVVCLLAGPVGGARQKKPASSAGEADALATPPPADDSALGQEPQPQQP